ncbi:hypothetical protein Bca4012_077798 [Brassica carinata]
MVFREWNPGRKRVGIAHEIPNLHQDYGISKQGKVHDDLIWGDQSGLIGLQGNMKKTGIDRGSKILRSTIYTDTCDLGSSSGDGLDNKGMIFILFYRRFVWIYLACRQKNQRFARSRAWKVWIGLLMWLRIIAILEDNQIGEREEKKQGPGKVLFKNQTVAGRSIMKKLVQGFVLPHKRTSAEAAKAGIRAHPNHDTFMDQSDKEVKLRWQILHLVSLNLQCKMEWKETTRICWVKDDHWCLLRIWNKDTIVLSLLLFFKYWNKNGDLCCWWCMLTESGFVAVL